MTYFVNLQGAKTDTELSKPGQPCSCALVSLAFPAWSPVVCSSDEDTDPREIWRDEGAGGTHKHPACLGQKSFSHQCAWRLPAGIAVLTCPGFSLCPGLGSRAQPILLLSAVLCPLPSWDGDCCVLTDHTQGERELLPR